LEDEDKDVRETAKWALENIRNKKRNNMIQKLVNELLSRTGKRTDKIGLVTGSLTLIGREMRERHGKRKAI
jgi:ribosomal protein S7